MKKSKTKTRVKAKPKKKAVKKPIVKAKAKLGKPAGVVSHYFSNIKVGVIKLKAPLKKGDEIRIVGGENTDFNQKIASMQIDHQEVKKAKKGSSIGVKIAKKVREGYKVYAV